MGFVQILAILSLVTAFPVVQSPATTSQSSAQRPEYRLQPITLQNAIYPTEARDQKSEGEVKATYVVSPTGEITNVHAWGHDAALSKAAEDALRKWKFQPVLKDGSAIQIMGVATFKFALDDGAQARDGVPAEIGAATDVPQKVRVSSGVSAGLLLHKVSPVYPEDARRNGIQGTVILSATIDHEGSVTNLQPISGPQELFPAAMEAVTQWRYRPYLMLGIPMSVETQIQVNFILRR